MATSWQSEAELLAELVSTPSVSGDEAAIAALVLAKARSLGLDAWHDATGLFVRVRGRAPGKTLALLSHLDVVPVGQGWTRDPWKPVVEGDKLYGRGSGDAKASVASMLLAAADVARAGGPAEGTLLCIFGHSEETRETTMGAAVASLETPLDAAIVGEPTNLELSIAQRGLMMVDLIASGTQKHAGYASEGAYDNAVLKLAGDLVKLPSLVQSRPHIILGQPTLTATMIEGGISRNVTPPSCKAVLDIRTTPAWSHEEVAAELRAALKSEVNVTSTRLVPCETPAGSRLLAACRRARPEAKTYGSPTCSDWVFVRHIDALKCGPGTSRRSHTADECVDLPELPLARAFYRRVAEEYLA